MCIESNWVSSVGPFVDRFERELALRLGTSHGVATCSGTAALHIALLVAGIQPDDEVLVPSLSFIAPVNAVRYAGAWPVFMDAEPDYWQMDPVVVARFLKHSCRRERLGVYDRATGRRVRAILPVPILGHPAEMDALLDLAHEYHLKVIEDAAESLGSLYRGQAVGSLGDLACLSFNGNKLLTTGGGGMILTSRKEWAQRARHLTTQAKASPDEYCYDEIGYNYRLTNLQAAVGCAQMERLDFHLQAKRQIASRYREAFDTTAGLTPMPEAAWVRSSFWMYTILVDENLFGSSATQLRRYLAAAGIQCRPLWQPLHLSRAHQDGVLLPCPVAERIARQGLSLPCSVGLTTEDQNRVISTLLGKACRSANRKPAVPRSNRHAL